MNIRWAGASIAPGLARWLTHQPQSWIHHAIPACRGVRMSMKQSVCDHGQWFWANDKCIVDSSLGVGLPSWLFRTAWPACFVRSRSTPEPNRLPSNPSVSLSLSAATGRGDEPVTCVRLPADRQPDHPALVCWVLSAGPTKLLDQYGSSGYRGDGIIHGGRQ